MELLHLNKASFEKILAAEEKPLLVDFWATWCGPCQSLTPELEALAEEHPEIIVGKISVEDPDNIQLASSLGVNAIPAMFFFRDGELVQQLVGFMKKDELAKKLGL